MKSKQAAVLAVVALALALVFAACGGGDSDTTNSSNGSTQGGGDEPTTIRYQPQPGIVNPLEMADHLGYLGDLELKDIGVTTGGPESLQNLATSQTDVSSGAFNGSIVKAIGSGAPVKAVIGGFGSDTKGFQGVYVTEDSPMKNAKDLAGNTVGVSTLGGTQEAWVKLWLKSEGMSSTEIGEVNFVVIPTLNALKALEQGQLDSVVLITLLLEIAGKEGAPLRELTKDIDVTGDLTSTSLSMRPEFIEDHPETTATLVSGVAKAIVYLQTTPAAEVIKAAELNAEKRGRPDDKELLKFWKTQGIANKGGVIKPKEFSIWINLMEEEGELQKGQVETDETFTNEFNPYATGGEG